MNEKKNSTTKKCPIEESSSTDIKTQMDESEVGYPDISKANTKFIVIASLIVLLIIFLLSVFVPDSASSKQNSKETSFYKTSSFTTF